MYSTYSRKMTVIICLIIKPVAGRRGGKRAYVSSFNKRKLTWLSLQLKRGDSFNLTYLILRPRARQTKPPRRDQLPYIVMNKVHDGSRVRKSACLLAELDIAVDVEKKSRPCLLCRGCVARISDRRTAWEQTRHGW